MKFEYATVPLLTHATKQILDTWGSDEWELVQVIPAPGGGDQLVAKGKIGGQHKFPRVLKGSLLEDWKSFLQKDQ